MKNSFEIARVNIKSPDASQRFVQSLVSTGFAVIENHGVSAEMLDEIYSEWSGFFKSSNKNDFKRKDGSGAGYFPFKSENAKGAKLSDLKEFYHVYQPSDIPGSVQTKSTWKAKIELTRLAEDLLLWIQSESPAHVKDLFTEPLPSMITNSPNHLLRILHYPPIISGTAHKINLLGCSEDTDSLGSDEVAVRAAAHEDINLITLLPAATNPGLQVLDADGNWHDVECDPGAIIVNVGDMLQLASQGHYKSTTHRVINPVGEKSKESRYSMPLFLHPRSEVQLSSEKTAGQYLNERLIEIGVIPKEK